MKKRLPVIDAKATVLGSLSVAPETRPGMLVRLWKLAPMPATPTQSTGAEASEVASFMCYREHDGTEYLSSGTTPLNELRALEGWQDFTPLALSALMRSMYPGEVFRIHRTHEGELRLEAFDDRTYRSVDAPDLRAFDDPDHALLHQLIVVRDVMRKANR